VNNMSWKKILKFELSGDSLPIMIGYWNNYGNYYPQYKLPPKPNTANYDIAKVTKYLNRWGVIGSYRGPSTCRICGKMPNGIAERSDGVYSWPTGLAHYVEAHQIALPDYFIEHIENPTKKGDLTALIDRLSNMEDERAKQVLMQLRIQAKEDAKQWKDWVNEHGEDLPTPTIEELQELSKNPAIIAAMNKKRDGEGDRFLRMMNKDISQSFYSERRGREITPEERKKNILDVAVRIAGRFIVYGPVEEE
tara:strand:+ start:756 stop:1505 length:750 start_codon:yes stop_codon:yes gene_type:complete